MRAPDESFTYSDAQWAAIKATLPPGIDGDKIMLGAPRSDAQFYNSERWRLTNAPSGVPLRATLDGFARYYAGRQPPTTLKQRAKATQRTLAVLEHAHHLVEIAEVRAALADLVSVVKVQRDKLPAVSLISSDRSDNARKEVRNNFWFELSELWDAIASTAARHLQRKELIRFLLAVSCPVFKTSEKAIVNYLDRRPQTSF